jgi:plastocyanin
MKNYKFLILIIFIFISCSNEFEQVRLSNLIDTPTPLPTSTPTPLPTSTPTPLPTSTPTPLPTSTPTPLPTSTPTPLPTSTPIPKKVDEMDEKDINISGFQFLAKEISIDVGTTITWTNKDNSIHTASSIDYKFDSGYLNNNQSYKFKFISAGIYTYRCNLHSGMIGKINVFAENGLLIDPTPTPSPTSTPTPNNFNQSDQISPSQPQSSYY